MKILFDDTNRGVRLSLDGSKFRKGRIEKDFMSVISKELRKQGCICYHIQDVGLGYKFLDLICVKPGGEVFFVEFKKINGMTFNVSQFEGSQVFLLRDLDKRGTEAYVAIFSVATNEWMFDTFSNIWNNKNDQGGIKIFPVTK